MERLEYSWEDIGSAHQPAFSAGRQPKPEHTNLKKTGAKLTPPHLVCLRMTLQNALALTRSLAREMPDLPEQLHVRMKAQVRILTQRAALLRRAIALATVSPEAAWLAVPADRLSGFLISDPLRLSLSESRRAHKGNGECVLSDFRVYTTLCSKNLQRSRRLVKF